MIDTTTSPAPSAAASVLTDVEQVVTPVLRAHGVELFDLSLRREQVGWVLRVVIDRDDGSRPAPASAVTVEQCAEISRDLSTALDVADRIANRYTLEVSSPGVERPLRDWRDYDRYQGQSVKIVLVEPLPGATRVLQGRLARAAHDRVWVAHDDGETVEVPLTQIKRAHLVFELPAKPKKNAKRKPRPRGER